MRFVKIPKINHQCKIATFRWHLPFNWFSIWSNCFRLFFRGYLRYKTITSQNVPPIAQIKIFLFRTKIMFCSQDIQVFVFLTIPWFTKSVTSRWVLVHEIRCIVEYMFWTTNHEVTKLGQLIDISKYNNFQ